MNLLILSLFLIAAAWFLRRHLRRGLSSSEEMTILARAGLTQRSGLALVSVSGRRLLIGYGEGAPVVLMNADGKPLVKQRPADAFLDAGHEGQRPITDEKEPSRITAKNRLSGKKARKGGFSNGDGRVAPRVVEPS